MSSNPDSILDSVKKIIGIESEDTVFDLDVTMHINAAFGFLQQLGVGSDTGFIIQDNTTLWSQYISNLTILSLVKTFISLSVRMSFDPPERFVIAAFESQLAQLAWRINVAVEQFDPPSDPFATASTAPQGVLKSYVAPQIVNLNFSSDITPDASQGNMFYLTMTGDCTIEAPISGADGQQVTIQIISNGFSASWGSGWDFGSAGAPTLSGAGKTDIISSYYKESAALWYAGFTNGF